MKNYISKQASQNNFYISDCLSKQFCPKSYLCCFKTLQDPHFVTHNYCYFYLKSITAQNLKSDNWWTFFLLIAVKCPLFSVSSFFYTYIIATYYLNKKVFFSSLFLVYKFLVVFVNKGLTDMYMCFCYIITFEYSYIFLCFMHRIDFSLLLSQNVLESF